MISLSPLSNHLWVLFCLALLILSDSWASVVAETTIFWSSHILSKTSFPPGVLAECARAFDFHSSKACINENLPLSQGSPFPDVFAQPALGSCLIGAFGPELGRVPQAADRKAWPDLPRQLLTCDSVTPALLPLPYGKPPRKLLKSSQWSLIKGPWPPEWLVCFMVEFSSDLRS